MSSFIDIAKRGDDLRLRNTFSYLIFFVLIACPVMGQVAQSRVVTEADYKLWHSVVTDKLSDDGAWISYKVMYDQADTLFVRNTRTLKTFAFAGGDYSSFSGQYFACIGRGDTLHLLVTKRLDVRSYSQVSSYQMVPGYIVMLKGGAEAGKLLINKIDGTPVQSIEGVSAFQVSPDDNAIVIARTSENEFEAGMLHFNNLKEFVSIHKNNSATYQKFRWSRDGKALAFLSVGHGAGKVFYYRPGEAGLAVLDCSEKACFSDGRTIQMFPRMEFSADGRRVFFPVQKERSKPVKDESTVQVWNAADKDLYPEAVDMEYLMRVPIQVMWEPGTGKITEVNSVAISKGGAVGTRDYALTFDPQQYEPQEENEADRDVYLTDLKSGARKKILEKQDGSDFHLMSSPEGRYIVYFREGHWFVYDVQNQKHTNLTSNIGVSFAIVDSDRVGEAGAYGSAGWTDGANSVYLYDQFDIWEVFPKSGTRRKITDGRERGIRFRIIPQRADERSMVQYWVRTAGQFNPADGLLLSAHSAYNSHTGYYSYHEKDGLKEIAFSEMRTRNVTRNKNRTVTAWIGERFDIAPEIFVARNGRVQSIYKSNAQHQKYDWGKLERVFYKSAQGKQLSGLLYYPFGFNPQKQYPMVVKIYEQQSQQLHYFQSPSLSNPDGFNVAHLCAQGYFVLLPDIVYGSGGVGTSALQCTEAAVNKALESGYIDPKRIGLTGHSFGGFQTNFIMTRSKMFACAVAGAGVSDLVSANHAVDMNRKAPSFFKIERGQYRIGGSLAEKRDYYIDNSPIFDAHQIEAPLLSWSGKEDHNVETRQSEELYMALRRLGKKHIMLLYEGEPHEMMKQENMIDLTKKIDGWFGHYLKGKPMETWMYPK